MLYLGLFWHGWERVDRSGIRENFLLEIRGEQG